MLRHPVAQINEAAFQIVGGKYDEAISTLTSVLKTLSLALAGDTKILITEPIKSGQNVSSRESSSSPYQNEKYDFYVLSTSFLKPGSKAKQPHERFTRTNFCAKQCLTSICPCPKQQMSIFKEPIVLRGDNFQTNFDTQCCDELSYVTIYNLALAHQLKTIDCAASFDWHLWLNNMTKAFALYQHAYRILMHRAECLNVPVVHRMAMTFNVGEIYRALGDQKKSKISMEKVLSMIMFVTERGDADKLGSSLDGFLNWIIPLLCPSVTASAA